MGKIFKNYKPGSGKITVNAVVYRQFLKGFLKGSHASVPNTDMSVQVAAILEFLSAELAQLNLSQMFSVQMLTQVTSVFRLEFAIPTNVNSFAVLILIPNRTLFMFILHVPPETTAFE